MMSKLILPVLATVLAFAQTTHTPPEPATQAQMRVNRLASELSLTDAQKASALTIFTNAITASQTVQTNEKTARTALAAAVKANNTAGIDQASATLGTLSGQLTAINAKADAAFYATLTPAQQTLYDARPHGGPGGPGGWGGFGPRGRGRN